jgi:hypothetical protein
MNTKDMLDRLAWDVGWWRTLSALPDSRFAQGAAYVSTELIKQALCGQPRTQQRLVGQRIRLAVGRAREYRARCDHQ